MNFDRRSFLKMSGTALALAVVPKDLNAADAANPKSGTKPNVIYILADDLGYDELGCYGNDLIKTPNIDRLAAEGIKFTQHYSGSALCAPSRCCLMTGKHTGHAWIRNNKPLPHEGNVPIPAAEVTVAELFKKAGYKTGCMGKWGMGFPGSEGDPVNQGFDHFFGYNCQRQAHSYYPDHLWRNKEKVVLEGNAKGQQKQYSHDLITKEALDFIDKNASNPFFVYLPYTIPHTALQVPDLGPYEGSNWSQKQKLYAAMVTRMDGDVGRILALLKKHGIDRNTLVIFASDNGTSRSAGVMDFFNKKKKFRASKGSLYEGGIRVPMVARWPGRIKPATVTDHVSAFWDFLPTCAELIDAEPPKDIDGVSMLPTLSGQPGRQKKHEYLYWELGVNQAIRKGDYKLVISNTRSGKVKYQLYDLATDVSEKNDISAAKPAIVQEMKALADKARVESELFPLKRPGRNQGRKG